MSRRQQILHSSLWGIEQLVSITEPEFLGVSLWKGKRNFETVSQKHALYISSSTHFRCLVFEKKN